MKVINTFFVLLVIGFVVSCASTQTPDSATTNEAKIKKLKQLGRKELIRLAVEKVRSGDNIFNPENYDQINVMASKYTIYVSFAMKFKYVPKNSAYKYDVTVDLYRYHPKFQYLLSCSSSPKSNPKGCIPKKKLGFFSPTEDSRKAIDFILNTINRTNREGRSYTKKTWPWDHEMIIRDKNDHYEIEERLPSVIGYYSIKKKSGEIYGESHMHIHRNFYQKGEEFEKEFEESTGCKWREKFEEIKD